VFTARYALSPNTKQIHFVFKLLKNVALNVFISLRHVVYKHMVPCVKLFRRDCVLICFVRVSVIMEGLLRADSCIYLHRHSQNYSVDTFRKVQCKPELSKHMVKVYVYGWKSKFKSTLQNTGT
jgi:hypothetical protein